MRAETSRLSQRVLKEAFQHPGVLMEGLFQFISARYKKIQGKEYFFACFSDGMYKTDLVVHTRLLNSFNQSVHERDVMKIKLICEKLSDTYQLFVEEFDIKYSNISQILGSPMPLVLESSANIMDSLRVYPQPLYGQMVPADVPRGPVMAEHSNGKFTNDRMNFMPQLSGVLNNYYYENERSISKMSDSMLPDYTKVFQSHQYQAMPAMHPVYQIPNSPLHPGLSAINYPTIPPKMNPLNTVPDNSRGLLGKRSSPDLYYRICDLTINEKNWTIKAKVLSKHDIKRFRNEQGLYFSTVLQDSSGKIRATFFNNAARMCHDRIMEGYTYIISGGEIERATRYNTTDHRFEIVFKETLKIQEAGDLPDLPENDRLAENVTINDIMRKSQNENVNIIAFIREEGDLIMKELRRGGKKELKQPVIVDTNGEIIEVCLWGEFAREVKLLQGHAYAIRNIKVKRFGEQTYLVWENYTKLIAEIPSDPWIHWALPLPNPQPNSSSSDIIPPPPVQLPPPRQIAEPLDHSRNESAINERSLLSISEVNKKCEEFFADPFNKYQKLVLEFCGYITQVSKSLWYESCGLKNCKKKIIELDNKKKYCSKCKMTISNPMTRFMADVKVVDGNDKIFGRIFGEDNCVNIFSRTVNDLRHIKDLSEVEFEKMVEGMKNTEFFFKVLVRSSEFQGETKIGVEFLYVQRTDLVPEILTQQLLDILC